MRHLSIAMLGLVALTVAGPSPVSAQPILRQDCVYNEYGRVACGPVVNFDPKGWPDDQFYYPTWQVGAYCPPGTVAGVAACIPWRLPRGSKCPQPNMRLREDGFCVRYSDRF